MNHTASKQPPPQTVAQSAAAAHVLVAEDDPEMRTAVPCLLEPHDGYQQVRRRRIGDE